MQVGKKVSIKSDPSRIGIVEEIQLGTPNNVFKVFIDNETKEFFEDQLEVAEDKSEYQFQSTSHFKAYLTSLYLNFPDKSSLYSLSSARIEMIPFQFRPVIKMIQADLPRILIADDVGIGKTIEAGLILKELTARSEINTVLVICPKPLAVSKKWMYEMERFDEQFDQIESSKEFKFYLMEYSKRNIWPDKKSRIIIPFSIFLKTTFEGFDFEENPISFDLVIVDEAHKIRNSSSQSHKYVKKFIDHAKAVVFLSATPIQTKSNDLFTLLKMLREDKFRRYDYFQELILPNKHLNNAIRMTREMKKFETTEFLNELNNFEHLSKNNLSEKLSQSLEEIRHSLKSKEILNETLVDIRRHLENLNPIQNLMNRTRRRDIGKYYFKPRLVNTLKVSLGVEETKFLKSFEDIYKKLWNVHFGNRVVHLVLANWKQQLSSSMFALLPFLEEALKSKFYKLIVNEMDDSENSFEEEEIFSPLDENTLSLINQAVKSAKLLKKDTKLNSLVGLIRNKQKEKNKKILIFCSFLKTIEYLKVNLKKEFSGVASITGGTPHEERIRINTIFSSFDLRDDSVDILLLSDVGCEGLDYQFCDTLVNFDLPWNPMRIEQRIGRIDRIGQKSEAVNIVNFLIDPSIDEKIYTRCFERIGLFKDSIGDLEEITGEITKKISDIALNPTLSDEEQNKQLEIITQGTINEDREKLELEEKEKALFGIDIKENYSDFENTHLSIESLQNLIFIYLSEFGIDCAKLAQKEGVFCLILNERTKDRLVEDFNNIKFLRNKLFNDWKLHLKSKVDLKLYFTFAQDCARKNSLAEYITPQHPLVKQAARRFSIKDLAPVILNYSNADTRISTAAFSIYVWTLKGIKTEISIQIVSEDESIENKFSDILKKAELSSDSIEISDIQLRKLENRHQTKFRTEKENFLKKNNMEINERIQSLNQALDREISILEMRLQSQEHVKIQQMHLGEIKNKRIAHYKRVAELEAMRKTLDMFADRVCLGLIN